jgi:hypothetical protein
VNASLAEQQRRIHELEMRAEQAQHAEQAAVPVEAPAAPLREEAPAAPDMREHRDERPPVREERAAPPPPRRAEEPRIDPKELLESAGLVMIETDRAKAQIPMPVAEQPQQPVGRPRRERPKAPPQDGELVQIETRK